MSPRMPRSSSGRSKPLSTGARKLRRADSLAVHQEGYRQPERSLMARAGRVLLRPDAPRKPPNPDTVVGPAVERGFGEVYEHFFHKSV